MGVLYKYEPGQFKDFLPKESKEHLNGVTFPLGGMFGKFEYENIIGTFLEKGVEKGEWQELEIRDVENAERMADIGYLSRCSPALKDPRVHKFDYLMYGTYMVTNESLERVLEKGKDNN